MVGVDVVDPDGGVPDAGLALRDDRVAQALDVDGALVERVDHLLEGDDAADDDDEGGVLAAEDLEAGPDGRQWQGLVPGRGHLKLGD